MPTTKPKNKKLVAVKSGGKVSVKKGDSLAARTLKSVEAKMEELRQGLDSASKEDKKAIRAQLKQLEAFKKTIPESVGADSDKPAKALLIRSIRTSRQKLIREKKTANKPRAKQIEIELENLRLLENQECSTIDPAPKQNHVGKSLGRVMELLEKIRVAQEGPKKSALNEELVKLLDEIQWFDAVLDKKGKPVFKNGKQIFKNRPSKTLEKISKAISPPGLSGVEIALDQVIWPFAVDCIDDCPAAAFLFERGLKKAEEKPGNRSENLFRFLCRYCVTFPDAKDELKKYDVIPAVIKDEVELVRIWAEVEKQPPLATQDTIDFLNEYLPQDSPLRASEMTHYRRAEEMRKIYKWESWTLASNGFPDAKKVENIFSRYGLEHGRTGRPVKKEK